jgi:hypothetical protein
MVFLKNEFLAVSILDPVSDRRLLGSRYCTGCYIYQIHDQAQKPLLSGPTFPDGVFNVFDGQGAPEVFVTVLKKESTPLGDVVCVPGVGLVTKTSDIMPFHVRNNPNVAEFVMWKSEAKSGEISMTCTQQFDDWHFRIQRSVMLDGKRVVSQTSVLNFGKAVFPLKWFPHPFFPFPQDHKMCTIDPWVDVPENQGYTITSDGFVVLKKEYLWEKGLYQPLTIPAGKEYVFRVQHPVCGSVKMTTSYPVSFLPIWANARTASVEPYFEKDVVCGEERAFAVVYEFGSA